jgi:hypothetical protein
MLLQLLQVGWRYYIFRSAVSFDTSYKGVNTTNESEQSSTAYLREAHDEIFHFVSASIPEISCHYNFRVDFDRVDLCHIFNNEDGSPIHFMWRNSWR